MPGLIERVKEAARGRWLDLLTDAGLPREALDGRHHPCPVCGGTDRFRLIDEAEGAVLCNQCFHERNGDGIAAVAWYRHIEFKEALRELADRLGIRAPRRKPEDDLVFQEWSPGNLALAALWCVRKRGITVEAIVANGGRFARWRGAWSVIALPIVDLDRKPTGWVMWHVTGGTLPNAEGEEKKVLVTTGSKTGWIGVHALEHLPTAERIWKVEGPSDLLALWAAIPEDLRSRHLVLSNPFGSQEKPKAAFLAPFAGRAAAVLHDLDEAGQAGAVRWAKAIAAGGASSCRRVELPAPPAPGQNGSASWKDVRDFLAAGHPYAELDALAAAAEPLDGAGEDLLEEADDDPARLAREFLRTQAGRLVHWREDYYRWEGGRWRPVPKEDIRSDVLCWIRGEFERIYREKADERGKREESSSKVLKLSDHLLSATAAAIRAFACVDSSIQWGSELLLDEDGDIGRSGRIEVSAQRRWVSLVNGVLQIPDLMDGHVEDALRVHTPRWWSPHRLPFPYDPTATATPPRWEDFLFKNLEADGQRIDLLQEWAGYCLLPSTDQQKFMILEGEGANGKSVYCAVLEALLGEENVSHVPLELFGQRFGLTPTLGKLANIITEVGDLDRLAEGYLKAFTDGSGLTFDRKNRDAIEARPSARLLIATNNRPRFSDRSGALWRRMILVPFRVEIPQEERVAGMDKPSWWLASGELPAIFNWALEGLRRLQTRGRFTEPVLCKEALDDYRIEANPAREFLLEACEDSDRQGEIDASALYRAYHKWCESNGYRPLGNRQFGKEVRRVFRWVERVRSSEIRRPWVYRGIRKQTNSHELFNFA